jgi:hypothetical protein
MHLTHTEAIFHFHSLQFEPVPVKLDPEEDSLPGLSSFETSLRFPSTRLAFARRSWSNININK